MDETTFEIRLCESCGLRYPLVTGHPHGTRCPICIGDTRLILRRELIFEPVSTRPGGVLPKSDRRSLVENQNHGVAFGEGRGGPFAVLLDNIRSAWNVGSILRSADGFGFVHAYLCGITSTPESDAVRKTALGAEDSVPWSYHKDAVKLIKGLKREGWHVIALEDDPRGIPIEEIKSVNRNQGKENVLIVGNEVTGIDPGLLDLCNEIVTIPMRGGKKSLNAAIAFGVAAYALTAPR
jgi:23S rRNA (guanosine2251-2'-O)-methyltransferase